MLHTSLSNALRCTLWEGERVSLNVIVKLLGRGLGSVLNVDVNAVNILYVGEKGVRVDDVELREGRIAAGKRDECPSLLRLAVG